LKAIVCPEASGKRLKALPKPVSRMEIYQTLKRRNKTESPISFVFPVRRGCVQTQRISVASAAWGMLFHESAHCAGLRVYSGPAANLHDKDLFHDDAV
jgi:hypothetical protein